MKVKGIVDIDFSNYKKPSLYIAFPHCNFKCGKAHCQNSQLVTEDNYDILTSKVINMFDANPVTQAVVCGGLEPFDSWFDLQVFIMNFRYLHPHEIVIYTGYTEEEVADKIEWLKSYENIIVKFGRYIPNKTPHFDKNLGVMLVSDNQYSKIYNGMEGYC
jgi:organic radical activating enzyme